MIKIYGMPSCPYCDYVLKQIPGDKRFVFIDIGKDISSLHAFLRLRDHNPVFKPYIEEDDVGVPCFVLEDGSVTLEPGEVGLHSLSETFGKSCSVSGHGC